MNLVRRFTYSTALITLFLLFSPVLPVFSAEKETVEPPLKSSSGTFTKLDGEILEVEELKEPRGSAIFTIKDMASGKTLRLFADPHRSLIQIGGAPKPPADVLGGSKVRIIYRKSPGRDIPEIVFAKVASSYYS